MNSATTHWQLCPWLPTLSPSYNTGYRGGFPPGRIHIPGSSQISRRAAVERYSIRSLLIIYTNVYLSVLGWMGLSAGFSSSFTKTAPLVHPYHRDRHYQWSVILNQVFSVTRTGPCVLIYLRPNLRPLMAVVPAKCKPDGTEKVILVF